MNYIKYILLLILIFASFPALASVSLGTIDATDYTAHLCSNDDCSENSSINFRTTNGESVSISDSVLTGEIWSENMGWIKLDPTTSGVTNTSEGVLGGYAWGEIMGWINFAPTQGGVSINTTGEFTGWAWAENAGWIKFDCGTIGSCVKTDWRPLSVRPSTQSITSGSYITFIAPISPIIWPLIPAPTVVPPIEIKEIPKENKNDNESISDSSSASSNGMISTIPADKFLDTPQEQDQGDKTLVGPENAEDFEDKDGKSPAAIFIEKVKKWMYTTFSNVMNFLFSFFKIKNE